MKRRIGIALFCLGTAGLLNAADARSRSARWEVYENLTGHGCIGTNGPITIFYNERDQYPESHVTFNDARWSRLKEQAITATLVFDGREVAGVKGDFSPGDPPGRSSSEGRSPPQVTFKLTRRAPSGPNAIAFEDIARSWSVRVKGSNGIDRTYSLRGSARAIRRLDPCERRLDAKDPREFVR